MNQKDVKKLIGLSEKEAKKIVEEVGKEFSHKLMKCNFVKNRIQVALNDEGIVTEAYIG